jgi:uncharacterized protein (DUF2252 family)
MTTTVADSAVRGREARTRCPRRSHATFELRIDRLDPVAILQSQARTRVPELVPIRYGRMLTSPFTFFRGSAAIMAGDLAPAPHSGLIAQCCGDAHLSNFGVFASPERSLVFDLNDFDETLPAPFEWDLKRLAASVLIAARENGHGRGDQYQAALATAAAYREAMAKFAAMGNLAVWYARVDAEMLLREYRSQLTPRDVKSTQRSLTKARTRDSMSALSKLTEVVDGHPRIVDQSPLVVPFDRIADEAQREDLVTLLHQILDKYRESLPEERRVLFDRFHLVDVAHKVVGVGSVGTRAWIALLLGDRGNEPLFLQFKEAQASVLEHGFRASRFRNHGRRVVVGQRLMQASSDVFLGWVRVQSDDGQRDYYVRQLRDWKGSANIDRMDLDGLTAYAQLCGSTLARAHARTGDRLAIATYVGRSDRFDRAIASFACSYAEQNELDYQALQAAVKEGRVEAIDGL